MFGEPFNWCDRRCERCPLTSTCTLHKRELQRNWVHTARGEDPNDWDVISADMNEDLARTERMLAEVAREEGIDLAAPREPTVASLDEARLRKATLTIVGAHPSALCFTQKCHRVVGAQPADRDLWTFDVVPNLFVIERLRDELAPELESTTEEVRAAMAAVERVLAPLFAAIEPDARRALEELVAARAAPSPFCRSEV